MHDLAFLLGLLASDHPAFVTAEDLEGPHGAVLKTWRIQGFIGADAGLHPFPSCPHCAAGVPRRFEGRLLCSHCASALEESVLHAWPVRREAVLTALASHLGMLGGVRRIDATLWELGTAKVEGNTVACFFHPGAALSPGACATLAAYRRTLVISTRPTDAEAAVRHWRPLTALLAPDGTFAAVPLGELLQDRGRVRYDRETGTLRVGTSVAGEVPPGSREWAFLECLGAHLDQFVPYGDLKRAVLRATQGTGDLDEATFCQKLKNRIKQNYVPDIDALVVTTNKGDGYRLRSEGKL